MHVYGRVSSLSVIYIYPKYAFWSLAGGWSRVGLGLWDPLGFGAFTIRNNCNEGHLIGFLLQRITKLYTNWFIVSSVSLFSCASLPMFSLFRLLWFSKILFGNATQLSTIFHEESWSCKFVKWTFSAEDYISNSSQCDSVKSSFSIGRALDCIVILSGLMRSKRLANKKY